MNKTCSQCEKNRPIDEFRNDKRASDGKRAECVDCTRVYQTKWKARNKEKIAAYLSEWRDKNREYVSTEHKKWRARNPGKTTEYSRRYRARYPEKVKEKAPEIKKNG